MRVHELRTLLDRYADDLEVELVIVCPVEHRSDSVEVDRYGLDGVLRWPDEDERRDFVWLVGGEEEDLEAFADAMGPQDEEGHRDRAGA
jgi:hypothetical protein